MSMTTPQSGRERTKREGSRGVRTDEGDTLDGLAEAHLVGEDAVVVLHPGVDEPVEALQLVVAQLPSAQEVWLRQQRPLPLARAPLRLQPAHTLY